MKQGMLAREDTSEFRVIYTIIQLLLLLLLCSDTFTSRPDRLVEACRPLEARGRSASQALSQGCQFFLSVDY